MEHWEARDVYIYIYIYFFFNIGLVGDHVQAGPANDFVDQI